MNRLFLTRDAIHFGDLILVNGQHPYREKHRPELAPVPEPGSPILLDRRAADPLSHLMAAIHGWDQIAPVSGWRSHQEQQAIWDQSLVEHGQDFTQTYVARPGCSEHETGLAIDLGLRSEDLDFIRPAFPYDGVCQTFRDLAPRYGFLQRYPAGKESLTGIGHEPWHFRYVGQPHASLMAELGLTLEEYLDFLRAYPHGERAYETKDNGVDAWVSYLAASSTGTTILDLPEGLVCTLSGNNIDGYIVTTQRTDHVRNTHLRRP